MVSTRRAGLAPGSDAPFDSDLGSGSGVVGATEEGAGLDSDGMEDCAGSSRRSG